MPLQKVEGGTGHVPVSVQVLCPQLQQQPRALSDSCLAKLVTEAAQRGQGSKAMGAAGTKLLPGHLVQSQTCLAQVQSRMRQRVLFHD